MKTSTRIRIGLILALAFACSGCSVSGLLGPNLNLNLVAPLGFGGAPGLFNPFGIVQAIVNALLGATFSASDGTSSTGSGMTNPPSNIGGITTVLS